MASTDSKTNTSRPFDTKTVEFLVKLMAEQELTEIDLHEGEHRIRLRRGPKHVLTAPIAAAAPQVAPSAAAPVPAVASTGPAVAKKYHEIKSPMVGTFYAKPSPDKDDYVKAGSPLKPDTVVCKLEAMKLFNELPAEVSGTVVEVCVKNGQPVEFGQVLFRVDTAN